MLLSQALDTIQRFTPEEFASLSDLLSPDLIDECLMDTGVVTLRKRRLSMEMMVWAVVGMTLYRSLSMNQLVSHLAGETPFCRAKRCGSGSPATRGRRRQADVQQNDPALV